MERTAPIAYVFDFVVRFDDASDKCYLRLLKRFLQNCRTLLYDFSARSARVAAELMDY